MRTVGETAVKSGPIRKLLRKFGDVGIWWVQDGRIPGEKWPMIHHVVSAGDTERTFERPHEAWEYFRKLTYATGHEPG